MPNPIMPGAIWDPGKGAGYAIGRNRMEIVKIHFTAGTNSYNIVKNGVPDAPSTLAQFLVPKVGAPWQFTEADALCYDSGPYNDDGPGIEWERLGTGNYLRLGLQEAEPLTPDQVEWGGRIIRWLHDEWGVPLDLYDGPRYGAPPNFRGFVNHGDLDSNRSDGVTREEWNALIGDDMTKDEIEALIESHLFDPVELNGQTLPSRFVMRLEKYVNALGGDHNDAPFGFTRFQAWFRDTAKKFGVPTKP